jgi:hypothetical protein
MESKGKTREIVAAIDQVYDEQLPFTGWGLGDGSAAGLQQAQAEVYDDRPPPPVKGSGPAAQAELARRETIENHRAADAYCKELLGGIRERVRV